MCNRAGSIGRLAMISIVAGCVTTTTAAGQTTAAAPRDSWTVPHTSWGAPDLQGIWTNATLTPVERPETLSTAVLSTEAAAQLEQRSAAEKEASDRFILGSVGAYNQFWMDAGTTVVDGRRTSPFRQRLEQLHECLVIRAAVRRGGDYVPGREEENRDQCDYEQRCRQGAYGQRGSSHARHCTESTPRTQRPARWAWPYNVAPVCLVFLNPTLYG